MTDREIYKLWLSKTNDHRYFRPNKWKQLKAFLVDNKVKTVIEFGSGVSTLLFSNFGCKITSYETDSVYQNFVRAFSPKNTTFIISDNYNFKVSSTYDLAFIDGIDPRLPQLEQATKCSNYVAIDDLGKTYKKRFSSILDSLTRLNSEGQMLGIFKVGQNPTNLGKWYQLFNLSGKPSTTDPFMTDEIFNQLRPLFPLNMENKKVLDLCCNAGLVSFNLAKLGADVTGIEKNPLYLSQASYVMQLNSLPKVTFINADVETYDFPSVDIIVALSCIYHLKNPKEFIKKLCATPSKIITSFRNSNYSTLSQVFKDCGRTATMEIPYARKRAILFE